MISNGALPAFNLDGKLLRLRPEDVEAFECRTGVSLADGECCLTWSDADGIRRRYRLGTSDPKEAARRAPARYLSLRDRVGRLKKPSGPGYTADMEGRAVVGTMKYTWKALAGRFGPMEAEAITIADCRAHTERRRAAGIKDGTIHTELGHLRMVLKWAAKHRRTTGRPTSSGRRSRSQKTGI